MRKSKDMFSQYTRDEQTDEQNLTRA